MNKIKKSPIFVLWYQGEKNAPPLVKMCIQSMRRNSNGHKVVVLDRENLSDWVDYDPIVKEKFLSKKFSIQLESDYIRLNILKKHSALWLDSTIFVSKPIPDDVFSMDFFAVIRKEAQKKDITNKLSPFLLGRNSSDRSKKVFSFAFDLMETYIKNEDDLINYLLIENILNIAIEKETWLNDLVNEQLFKNKQDILGLVKLLNDPMSAKVNKFLYKNLFNKLNFHQNYDLLTSDGQETVYSYLLNNKEKLNE
ncbi:capsular polysaccharide synthesis protein [Lactobacillus isalae]|uniref:capsular polysaccharide synthesis protein n=1 Tax=Lactobacillus isalae TaxID=2993455 RepID=UPI0024A8B237|nr:capsular polysaccharide synthesis protein [Lactobacillus isalae]